MAFSPRPAFRRGRAAVSGLLAWSVLASCAVQDHRGLDGFRSEALRNEAEGAWREIGWQRDLDAALEAAGKEAKPILVVLVVGHRGQKDAAEC